MARAMEARTLRERGLPSRRTSRSGHTTTERLQRKPTLPADTLCSAISCPMYADAMNRLHVTLCRSSARSSCGRNGESASAATEKRSPAATLGVIVSVMIEPHAKFEP
eukprot:2735259-Rhodomonas_salina.1